MTAAIRIGAMFVATAVLGYAPAVWAQSKPCMADAARLCPDVEPGGGAQIQCLKEHKEQLSPECKKNVMKMKVKQMEKKELQEQQQQPEPPKP